MNLPVPMESRAAVLVESVPIVPDEGRVVAPIAIDKLLHSADTLASTLAAAAAGHTLMRPRDPFEPDTPTIRAQNSEGSHSQRDRVRNILHND